MTSEPPVPPGTPIPGDSTPEGLVVRPAEPDDIGALARLWDLAFPGERTAEARAQALEEGSDPLGGRETCWVLEAPGGGPVVGGVRLYSLEMHLFGQPVPAAGVGALAIDPGWREQGLGSALLRRALRIARDRGDHVAVLYPMRAGFYSRLGFSLVGTLHRYRFPPHALPPFPGAETVRVLSREERIREVPELHRRFAPSGHGLTSRSEGQWRHLESADCLVAAAGSGEDMAAFVARVRGSDDGLPPSLEVREVMAGTHDGYRALLGWLARQGEAWGEITWDALPGERFGQVLRHPRLPGTPNRRGLWYESATLLRGPMVRILDLPGLTGRLGIEPGTTLTVHDAELPENSGAWQGEQAPGSDSIGVHLARSGGGGRAPGDSITGGAIPIGFLSGVLMEGAYPALALASRDFQGALGIPDFRFWDVF